MRVTRIAVVIVAAVVASATAAAAAVFGFGGSREPQAPEEATITFKAIADTYVAELSPTENFGGADSLVVDGTPKSSAYLRFDVTGVPGPVTGATLRVHAQSGTSRGYEVLALGEQAWDANALTFLDAPQAGPALGSSGRVEADTYSEVDVTTAVGGNGPVGFVLSPLGNTRLLLSSAESPQPPELVLTYTKPAADGGPVAGDLGFPVRAAFFYPWFPEAWEQGGTSPFTQYHPTLGAYDSRDPDVIDQQVELAGMAGLDAFIASWWGGGHHTDAGTRALLERIPSSPNPDLKVAVYYEEEGQSDPSAQQIADDLRELESSFFSSPAYLRVEQEPVVFVWADPEDGAAMAQRWAKAKELYGSGVHVVLKVFSGYDQDPTRADSWHQYGPAKSYSEHLPWSAVVSPGFWHARNEAPRLERDLARFESDLRRMVDSGAQWQLVTSWNEWGEGTSVEPAQEYGNAYIDVMAEVFGAPAAGGGDPVPVPTATAQPAPPASPGSPRSVTFAAGGDFGANENTQATLDAIAASDAEFLLALGDLSYKDATAEQWCKFVSSTLGSTFPVELLVGNHEDDDRTDGYIGDFAACLPDRMDSTGVYAAEYFFDVGGVARVIMIGAGNDVAGEKYDYEPGNSHWRWLEQTIDDARASGIKWVIVGSHKPCITAGNKRCEIGPEVYGLLLEKRVDLILHGHDHSYQRSAQLTCVVPEVLRTSCIADTGTDGRYVRGAGSVFAIVGVTGGGGHTAVNQSDPEFGYLAAAHGASSPDPGRGYLQVTVDADRLEMEFVGTTTSYTDRAVIE